MLPAHATARACAAALAAAVALLTAGNPARADSPSLFGLSSRWAGMADAAVSLADDFAAAFYNPAGLAMAPRGRFHAGVMAYGARLRLPQGTAGIDNPAEVLAGITFPFPFKGKLKNRFWMGFSFALHPEIITRVKAHLPTDVFYPYYDNRSQRITFLPGLAVRLLDHPRWGVLTVGVSLNAFAGLDGTVVGIEGASRALEARVSEELPTIIRVNGGVMFRVSDFHVGVAYRQQFDMEFATRSINHVAGTDLNLDIKAHALFDPHTFVFGAAWTPGRWRLAVDVGYSLWRFYKGPYVQVDSLLPLVGDLTGDTPDIPFSDAVAVRVGLEHAFVLPRTMTLALRGGFGFESTPVPEQHGRTNMLDGHRLTVSLGTGLDLGKVARKRMWVDLHVRTQFLLPRHMTKEVFSPDPECPAPPSGSVDPDRYLLDERPCDRTDPTTLGIQISNPGYPSVKSSGWVLSAGLTLGVEL